MRTPQEGIDDLQRIKDAGLRGVMMPGLPGGDDDYDSPAFDEFWDAAIELGLPLSFHILTTRSDKTRGPNMNSFLSVVRGCQDIMGMLVLGGVFERHPDLRIVCVEADAGWVPHFMYRMDHAYKRHRYWLPAGQELTRLPSEWFSEQHLHHVPGRLDGVPLRRRHELEATDVGQRLPPQRLHVAVVAGDAGRAHQGPDRRAAARHPERERGRAVQASTSAARWPSARLA